MIQAPFNFVPLSGKMYTPGWIEQISHDVPFSDGISGEIKLNFTAKTPIYVRNGQKESVDVKGDKKPVAVPFSNISGSKYFIPATSLKGCIRNVLEILSFGGMSRVDNKSFGLRNLNDVGGYRNKMKDVRCGWLQRSASDNESYVIYDSGEPYRISFNDIVDKLCPKKRDKIKAIIKDPCAENVLNDSVNTNRAKELKLTVKEYVTSAIFKYDLLSISGHDMARHSYRFVSDTMLQNKVKGPRKFYKFSDSDSQKGIEGILVLTGQCGPRKKTWDKKTGKEKWTGKLYDFIFRESDAKPLTVSDDVMKAFRTIHECSPSYTRLWGPELAKGERVPVFFNKRGNRIENIGLAYMYKFPFEKSVHDAIPAEMLTGKDMADAIFGRVDNDDDKLPALRGRVQFGHAMAKGKVEPESDPRSFAAYSPHPSYYPIYVRGRHDWNDAKEIAGWKRYLIRDTPVDDKTDSQNGVKDTSTVIFLKKGAKFESVVRFHNLRPAELGALLSAITFHGNNDKCYHSIGFGKPYGYGKVEMADPKVFRMNDATYQPEPVDIDRYLDAYEAEMDNNMPKLQLTGRWRECQQVKELMTIASVPEKAARYMSLKEYQNEKRSANELPLYSHRYNGQAITLRQLSPSSKPEKNVEPGCHSATDAPASVESMSTALKRGECAKAHCHEKKKVRIDGCPYDIQLVVRKGFDANELVGKHLQVEVKQISNTGKIVQVDFIKEI